jgi:Protein of unknown function (DUF1524)
VKAERQRRLAVVIIATAISLCGALAGTVINDQAKQDDGLVKSTVTEVKSSPAAEALDKLEVKGRAPKTGYSRDQFSKGWADAGNCDMRNFVLGRDMNGVITRSETDCTVMQGTLQDPYTGKSVMFVRGADTSDDVQVDHVVALSNAWQTGAQQISAEMRHGVANDGLNLLAVDGPTNQKKGDSDAATWLPPNKDFRCRYVARQIAVKQKYSLWVTQPEKDAMKRVLNGCPDQVLPVEMPNN